MTAQTNAQRQAALVQRRTEAGLKIIRNLWAHPDDEAKVKAYVARLNRQRARHDERT